MMRVLRWLAALGWTAFIILLMLLPGNDSLTEDLSNVAGGSDFTDWLGHIGLFGSLALVWWQALGGQRSAAWGAGISASVGVTTETLQAVVPERGFAVADILGNVLGAGLAYVAIVWVERRLSGRRTTRQTPDE